MYIMYVWCARSFLGCTWSCDGGSARSLSISSPPDTSALHLVHLAAVDHQSCVGSPPHFLLDLHPADCLFTSCREFLTSIRIPVWRKTNCYFWRPCHVGACCLPPKETKLKSGSPPSDSPSKAKTTPRRWRVREVSDGGHAAGFKADGWTGALHPSISVVQDHRQHCSVRSLPHHHVFTQTWTRTLCAQGVPRSHLRGSVLFDCQVVFGRARRGGEELQETARTREAKNTHSQIRTRVWPGARVLRDFPENCRWS